nr:transposase [Pseudorhodoferax sp. Leaf267]
MKSESQLCKASRRQHDLAFKRDAVQQCLEPGASVSAIALRSGVNANMLFKWRRDRLRHSSRLQPALLPPIQVAPEVEAQAHAASPAVAPLPRPPARSGVIELEIAGAQLRLRGPVDEDS